jgi:uncharacterized protein
VSDLNPLSLIPKSIVKQYFKFGITFGIAGILLFGYSSPILSVPPVRSNNPSAQSTVEPKTAPQGQKLPLTAQFSVKGQTILLEVARTPEEQSMGLMYRTELAANRGMLFSFSPPRAARFWMKNTLIPLDMLFVSNGVVKYIGANIPPCKQATCPDYGPNSPIAVDSVIELRGGRAAELGIKVGDRLKITNYSAKRLKSR